MSLVETLNKINEATKDVDQFDKIALECDMRLKDKDWMFYCDLDIDHDNDKHSIKFEANNQEMKQIKEKINDVIHEKDVKHWYIETNFSSFRTEFKNVLL